MRSAAVRVAVVGICDDFLDNVLPELSLSGRVRFTDVYDGKPEALPVLQSRFGFLPMDHWEEVLDSRRSDAVLVGAEPHLQAPIVLSALARGLNVLCCRPTAGTLADAMSMAVAARSRPDLVTMVCSSPLRFPHDSYVQKFLRSGRLGWVTTVDVIHTSDSDLRLDDAAMSKVVELPSVHALRLSDYAETLNTWVGPYEHLIAVTNRSESVAAQPEFKRMHDRGARIRMIAGTLRGGAAGVEYHSGLSVLGRAHDLLTIYGTLGTFRYNFVDKVPRFAPRDCDFADMPVDASELDTRTPGLDFIKAIDLTDNPEAHNLNFDEVVEIVRKLAAIQSSNSERRLCGL
jgi:predicted dehydrogenase